MSLLVKRPRGCRDHCRFHHRHERHTQKREDSWPDSMQRYGEFPSDEGSAPATVSLTFSQMDEGLVDADPQRQIHSGRSTAADPQQQIHSEPTAQHQRPRVPFGASQSRTRPALRRRPAQCGRLAESSYCRKVCPRSTKSAIRCPGTAGNGGAARPLYLGHREFEGFKVLQTVK